MQKLENSSNAWYLATYIEFVIKINIYNIKQGGIILGKILSVANQKGGVGKTTTTVNLSAGLANRGKKVLIIDADPQGNATSALGVDKECELSTYDVLVNEVDMKEVIQQTGTKKLDICPSNINLAGAEVQLVSMVSREQRLKEQLDKIRSNYDYIFIDCPPSLGLITLNAFTASDRIFCIRGTRATNEYNKFGKKTFK
mgnify:CR=1 FL=1